MSECSLNSPGELGQRGIEQFCWSIFLAGWAIGLLFSLNQMWAGDGFLLDDEITHYLRSRSVWQHPRLLFDAWTRPGRNLLHVLVAPWGLQATRFYTLLMLMGGTYITYRLASRLGISRPEWVPLLFFVQPWVIELGYGVLTQTPFLVVWIAAIALDQSKKSFWAGLLFGYLPLVRHEGIALTACYGAYCVWKRQWAGLAATAVPLLAINGAAYLLKYPLPTRVYGQVKPTEIYGSGPIWHFVKPTLFSAGVMVCLLAVIGIRRWSAPFVKCPLLWTYPLYFVMHSVIYWKGLFASGGYVYFLMPMAPLFCLGAVLGVETILDAGSDRRWSWGLVLLICSVGAIEAWAQPQRLSARFAIEQMESRDEAIWRMVAGFPLKRDPVQKALDEAVVWLRARPEQIRIMCHHPLLNMRMDLRETRKVWNLNNKSLDCVPEEVIYVWEEKYAPHQQGRMPEDFGRAGWEELARFGGGSVIVYSNQKQFTRG